MPSVFQNMWQVFVRCGFALLLFQCCGCAHLAVVRTKRAQLPRTVVAEGPLESAKRYLAAAEHEQPVPALNHDLLAAKISYGVLERQPKDESARRKSTLPSAIQTSPHLRADHGDRPRLRPESELGVHGSIKRRKNHTEQANLSSCC